LFLLPLWFAFRISKIVWILIHGSILFCVTRMTNNWRISISILEVPEKVVNFGKTCKDLMVDSVRNFRFILVYGDELFVIFQWR
jgi:hypothetical protein